MKGRLPHPLSTGVGAEGTVMCRKRVARLMRAAGPIMEIG
jgi:hypothetical protein